MKLSLFLEVHYSDYGQSVHPTTCLAISSSENSTLYALEWFTVKWQNYPFVVDTNVGTTIAKQVEIKSLYEIVFVRCRFLHPSPVMKT
jgi:hypothetical protein